MSNFSGITAEETAKFVMIIESIISNCDKLFSEIFDESYELNNLLRTIGLGEFTSDSKRLYGNLTLIYDKYKSDKMSK
jgi:hypothetical protein